jgi:glyoxylate reductase
VISKFEVQSSKFKVRSFPMPSVFVTGPLPESALEILRGVADVEVAQATPDAARLHEAVRGHSAIVSLLTSRIDAAVLDAAGASLKVVSNVAVGYDNIDIAAAQERGVIVTNTPDVLTNATAQFGSCGR